MTYTVAYAGSSAKFLSKLRDEKLKGRIDQAIADLSADPRPPQCKKMVGHINRYRVRVGDYRIIYEINDGTITILVLAIGHRKEVYD